MELPDALTSTTTPPITNGMIRNWNDQIDQLKIDNEALHQQLEKDEKVGRDAKAKLKRLNDKLEQAKNNAWKAEKKAEAEAKAAHRAEAQKAKAQKASEDAIDELHSVQDARERAQRNANRFLNQLQQAQKEVTRLKKKMEHDSAADVKVNLLEAEKQLAKAKADNKEAAEKLQQTKKNLQSQRRKRRLQHPN